MKSINQKIRWLVLFCVVLLTAACGYQFEGGGLINENVRQVSVTPLENKSSETGAGVVFTNALIREIIEKTNTQVVDESKASAIFSGKIKAITFSALSRTTTETVNERRVQAVVDLKLVDRQGKVIWSVRDFSTTQEYTVDPDKVTDESNKRQAVEKIAGRVAEKLVSQTKTDF